MNVCRSPSNALEFDQYYQLRWEMLRKPWQQPIGSERDDNENESTHRMIVDENNQVIAVGRLEQINNVMGQIRFMAVRDSAQGQGLGKQMMKALELAAKEQGLTRIVLHAREKAEAFYLGLGYQSDGLSHLLYGQIQHICMNKNIDAIEVN